jgi:chloride channel 2
LGKIIAGELDNKQAIMMLFENKTWSDPTVIYINEAPYLKEDVGLENITIPVEMDAFGWNRLTGKPTGGNLYISLTLFILVQYLSAAIAQTIQFPCGVFMPIFMVGAAFGRLLGESMYAWFPNGFKGQTIIPGGYAVVGAAAFAGGVTQTSRFKNIYSTLVYSTLV